jgi:DNA-binding LytR/AlgR family response regulator
MSVLEQLQTLARRQSARIAVKAMGRIVFIHPAEIIAIEAKGNHVLLHRTASSHLLRESISTMENWLAAWLRTDSPLRACKRSLR